jgi:hypothetical protein
MFFVELKSAPNSRGIFNVGYIQQCKIKFERHKYKRDIAQQQIVEDMGTPTIIAISKRDSSNVQVTTRQTNATKKKKNSSHVQCILCGGNHPANYKGCRSTRTYKRKHTHLSV